MFYHTVIEQEAPTVTQHPSSVVLDLASSINLTCMATGTPAPNYSWFKDGELIEGEATSSLYIPEAQPENRGVYTCKVRNTAGEAISEPASISIQGAYNYVEF